MLVLGSEPDEGEEPLRRARSTLSGQSLSRPYLPSKHSLEGRYRRQRAQALREGRRSLSSPLPDAGVSLCSGTRRGRAVSMVAHDLPSYALSEEVEERQKRRLD